MARGFFANRNIGYYKQFISNNELDESRLIAEVGLNEKQFGPLREALIDAGLMKAPVEESEAEVAKDAPAPAAQRTARKKAPAKKK